MDCYNANPSSLRDSLEFFYDQSCGRKKMLILGGMEELVQTKRNYIILPVVRSILEMEDRVILVGKSVMDGIIHY